jgi:hypothetical protein
MGIKPIMYNETRNRKHDPPAKAGALASAGRFMIHE